MKTKRLLALLLAGVMSVSLFSGSALADEPKPVENTYQFDGINYVNVGDASGSVFKSSDVGYFQQMLRNTKDSTALQDFSISDLWMQLGYQLSFGDENANGDNGFVALAANHDMNILDLFNVHDNGPYNCGLHPGDPNELDVAARVPKREGIGANPVTIGNHEYNCVFYRDTLKVELNEQKMVDMIANVARFHHYNRSNKIGSARLTNVSYEDPDNALPSGKVAFTTVAAAGDDIDDYKDGRDFHGIVVAFHDFSITPIIPDDDEASSPYETVISSGSSDNEEEKVVSDVKNMSDREVTATQSISESIDSTVSSTIEGSSSYTYGGEIKIGHKGSLFGTTETSIEITAKYERSVSKGWSKEESDTIHKEKTRDLSVTLPPFTTVLMSQKNETKEGVTTYNCPVALNFKVTILSVYGKNTKDGTPKLFFHKLASFGDGNDAIDDLSYRYKAYKEASTTDREGIRWRYFDNDHIEKLFTTLPFASTPAKFEEKYNTVSSQVEGILPIYPISVIKPSYAKAEETSQLTYEINMMPGEKGYTDHINLAALNKYGAEFAGFNKDFGHFIVTDAKGKEDTSGKVIKLEKDPATGQTKFTAVAPGTAYLKYMLYEKDDDEIDPGTDDVYKTANMEAGLTADKFVKNSSIKTAVIQINVTEEETEKPAETEKQTEDLGTISGSVNDKQTDKPGETNPITVQVNVKSDAATPDTRKETQKETTKVRKANVYAKMTAKGENQEVISWKRVPNADGYQVYFASCDDDTYSTCRRVKTTGSNTFKYTKKNLKAGTPYKAYVRAFAKVNGKKVTIGKSLLLHSVTGNEAGGFTNAAKIKGGKSNVTVKAGKSVKLKGQKLVLKKKGLDVLDHCAKFRYVSSNKKIATVSSSGKITGVKKGSCKVYIFAPNGVRKTVSVKVK